MQGIIDKADSMAISKGIVRFGVPIANFLKNSPIVFPFEKSYNSEK